MNSYPKLSKIEHDLATLVRPNEPTYFGRNKHYDVEFTCNENGEQLTNFCAKKGLGLLNSYFYHSKKHQITHISNLGQETANKTLDYALTTQLLATFCKDCRVRRGYLLDTNISTDHFCLIQRWKTPLRRMDEIKKRISSKPPPDLASLKDSCMQLEYQQKLREQLANLAEEHPNFDERAMKIAETMNMVAQETLPLKRPESQNFPWRHDAKIQELKKERGRLKYCNNNKLEFRRLSKLIKQRANELKSQFYKEKADNINLAAINRDLEKLFWKAKNINAFTQKATPPAARANFKEHFSAHFNKKPPDEYPVELQDVPEYLVATLDQDLNLGEIDSDPPTAKELPAAIRKLKTRKSAEDIAPELLRAASEDPVFLELLRSQYEEVWVNETIPLHWRYARLKALFKNKGSADDASNYRGISIGSTQLKILCVVILTRLKDWYECNLSEGQYGFRFSRVSIC
eukprot:gene14561-16063_t